VRWTCHVGVCSGLKMLTRLALLLRNTMKIRTDVKWKIARIVWTQFLWMDKQLVVGLSMGTALMKAQIGW
jgi:hypothetical protein